jgi:prepilin-type N-terminal cleavage/methylation domain-containing protein
MAIKEVLNYQKNIIYIVKIIADVYIVKEQIMKNNKGFTLVELLAVISILAIIMIIAVPAVQNAFYKAKAGISKINENNLKEAGKTVATEIMYCDPSDKDLITF